MKRAILKILNPVLAVLLLNQLLTATLHGAIPRKVYELLHGGGGITFAWLCVLHVILNWNWVKANFLNKAS